VSLSPWASPPPAAAGGAAWADSLPVVYFLPVIIATVVVARVWQGMIYNPQSGLVGWLKLYGVTLADPLALPPTALDAVAGGRSLALVGIVSPFLFFAALPAGESRPDRRGACSTGQASRS